MQMREEVRASSLYRERGGGDAADGFEMVEGDGGHDRLVRITEISNNDEDHKRKAWQ